MTEYELELPDIPDSSIDVTQLDPYSHFTDMIYIHRDSMKAQFNNFFVPMYMTNSQLDRMPLGESYFPMGFICIEEAADRLDCMHYEWIEDEGTLHVYISDDMVTYDDALKAILDKKGIAYNEAYNGDYFKDIDAMQKYSSNNLSVLVQAGIKSGIIKESDYRDGHLRPTRNISHIDFARMLSGIGYNYSYSERQTNIPVTSEEVDMILAEL